MNIVQLDRTAVLESVRIVDSARPGDWERPTPCSRWSLRELVEHMAAQHHGFAAAAHGKGADATAWQQQPLGGDPAGTYRSAARTVLDAFAQPDVLRQEFVLPELSATPFTGSLAAGFHFIDYVAHSWDAAAALGLPLRLPAELVEAALPIALAVPDGAARLVPGAAFRPALRPGTLSGTGGAESGSSGANTLSLVLAALGRSADWAAPGGR